MTNIKQKYEHWFFDLSLISQDGTRSIRLDGVFDELTIVESIFNTTTRGSITITDTNGIYEAFPITGREYIYIDFAKTNEMTADVDRFKYMGYVYKVVDRKLTDEKLRSQTYTLFFTSVEALLNRKYKVDTNITGTPSEICEKIFNSKFDANRSELLPITKVQQTRKSIEVEKTMDVDSLTFPNVSPLKAIEILKNTAYSQSNSGYFNTLYMFYEDRDKFRFRSVENMVLSGSTTPEQFLFRIPSANDDSISYNSMRTVSNFNVSIGFDTLRSAHGGEYGSTLVTFDPLTKTVRHNKFNYSKMFDFIVHIDDHNQIDNDFLKDMEQGTISVGDTNIGQVSSSYINGKESIYYMKDDVIRQLKVARKKRFMSSQVVSFVVPGNPHRRLGEIINLRLPSTIKDGTGDSKRFYPEDRYHSGKHLITELKHMITSSDYSMEIVAAKDGIKNEHE